MRSEIKLYDTLDRKVKTLERDNSRRFGIYVCGPTVYGPAHIGNFLTFVRFDVVYRTLRNAGYEPLYVRNITDVDDKTIRGSVDAGKELREFTKQWTDRFHEDCAALNCLQPDHEPRATDHIPEQIDLVTRLVEKGLAYQGEDGSVYFRVGAFEGYGKLSHFDPESLRTQKETSAGRQNLADEYEREAVADFAVWKARKPEDGRVFWDSPWGQGRPGWHLECSAMSMKYLGTDFALHGGGEDLCFPHHENEIAQSEGATGKRFARHWVHMVHLLVEGKKMSKSLGNFYILSDLLDKGWTAEEVRYALLGGHYRQQVNFTEGSLVAARSALQKIRKGVDRLLEQTGIEEEVFEDWVQEGKSESLGVFENSWGALCHDLNTPAALGGLHSGLKRAVKSDSPMDNLRGLALLLNSLGIRVPKAPSTVADEAEPVPESVKALAERRWNAKKNKDFAEADRIRSELMEAGFEVIDGKEGYQLQSLGV